MPDSGGSVEVRDVGVRVHRYQDVCHVRVDLVLHVKIIRRAHKHTVLDTYYTVKKFFDIPVPSRDVTYKSLPSLE